jgi:hypothetical protein
MIQRAQPTQAPEKASSSVCETEARIVRPAIFLRWLHKRARTPTSNQARSLREASRVGERDYTGQGTSRG